ncbi:MAG: SDR family oxidoreductase [Dehalococcoidia bacterium]|nr:SDR family oxidoreductase [Dehalococcoidia bacterium]
MKEGTIQSLKGKVVVVTGASRGIGRATALYFAKEGAKVVGAARSTDQLETLVQEICKNGGEATWVGIDITKPEDSQRMVKEALDRYGAIDVLVNNAGVGWVAPVTEHPLEQWHRVIDTDLNGVFYAIKAVLPSMIERKAGHIINISSVNGKRAGANWGAYVPTKFALTGLGDMVQLEVKEQRIKVTTVYVGGVATGFRDSFDRRYVRAPQPPQPGAPPPDPRLTVDDVAECIVSCAQMGLSPTSVLTEVTLNSWGLIR